MKFPTRWFVAMVAPNIYQTGYFTQIKAELPPFTLSSSKTRLMASIDSLPDKNVKVNIKGGKQLALKQDF